MKAVYNKSKIMLNAWYMFRVKMAKNFAEALRKAWKNEKMANIRAMIEGRTLIGENVQAATTTYCPGVLTVPVDYYGVRGRYYGD